MSTQTTRSTRRFEPKPNDIIVLFGKKYYVQPHPSANYMPYASEGRRAVVYQLRDASGGFYALKVFRKKYGNDSLLASVNLLGRFETLEGMRAAKRRVVSPTDSAAQQCRDLEYAMLMEWIRGKTWFDVLVDARLNGTHLSLPTAIHLCSCFLNVMRGLEAAAIAHSDISPGNIMLDVDAIGVQIIDLEDIYAPDLPSPAQQNTGSSGYRHRSADRGETTWRAEGDRYAAAIIAAEMLVLAEPDLARNATDEGYFAGHCRSSEGARRYEAARGWLKKVAPTFAELFEQVWLSESLAQCHKLVDLHASILPVALQTQRARQPTIKPPVKWSWRDIGKTAGDRNGLTSEGKPSPVKWERPRPPERKKKKKGGLHPLAKVTLAGATLLTVWLLLKLLALL